MTDEAEPEPPRRGVIFVNPGSGPGATSIEELRRRFPGHTVEECPPDRLADAVGDALATGPDFIGVAGGDGTIRTVAEQLVGTEVDLLPIPAGTRNHFARDVGVEDLDAAERAADGPVITVDVGRVNGKCFVNNSSIGVYPKIVIRRETHERRLRKGVATVVAAYEQLRVGDRVNVEVDGVAHCSWMVFVGNGTYGEGLMDLGDRESLTDGLLDIRVVRADQPFSRLRVVGALVLGRLARSPLVLRRQAARTVCVLNRDRVEVALDGEVEDMVPPLRYECLLRQLRVLVPAGEEKGAG